METLLTLVAQIEALKEENRELRAELYDARERILDLEGN